MQSANRTMNEQLAVRKYKQNINDKELRAMALAAEHNNLSDAIEHATSKYEQWISSNLHKKDQDKKEQEKKEQEPEKANKNNNKPSFKYNKSKPDFQNKNKNNSVACAHCKKNNHQSDQCYFKPGGSYVNKNGTNEQAQNKSSNTAAALAQPNVQIEATASTSSAVPQQAQSVPLQPYHFLGC